MADFKLSSCPVASTIDATVLVPILKDSTNMLMTVGQAKTFINSATNVSTSNAAISLSYNVVGLTGTCTLPASTTANQRILLISEAAGKVVSVGNLPSDGFTFAAAGAVLDLVWFASKWNVVSVNGMTAGIV